MNHIEIHVVFVGLCLLIDTEDISAKIIKVLLCKVTGTVNSGHLGPAVDCIES